MKPKKGDKVGFEYEFLDGVIPQDGIDIPTRDMELFLMGTKVRVTIEVLQVEE